MVKLKRVKYMVFFSYLGRSFNGFQKQYQTVGCFDKDLLTVQDIIETHIYKMGFNRVYMFTGTRTDRGVNAYRHPVIIDVEDPEDVRPGNQKIYSCKTFKKALNHRLWEEQVSVADVYFLQERFVNMKAVKQK